MRQTEATVAQDPPPTPAHDRSEPYRPERDEQGHLVRVLRQPGAVPILADPDDQAFCDFLTWASHQQPPPNISPYGPLVSRSHYFADMDRLVEHCKSRGHVIYTTRAFPQEYQVMEHVGSPSQGPGEYNWSALPIAVAAPDGYARTATDGLSLAPSNTFLSARLRRALQEDLMRGDENSPVRRLSTWRIRRAFVYLDVSDFSAHEGGQGLLVINSIIQLTGDPVRWHSYLGRLAQQSVEAKLCIGDGYIFVLTDPAAAVAFAACLAVLVELAVAGGAAPVEFHFRIGVHYGPVYCFWDPGRGKDGHWNYTGDGINGGKRVIDAIGKDQDDVVFISDQVRREVRKGHPAATLTTQILEALNNRGRRLDKHGTYWRVYEVDHTKLTSGYIPGHV
jgi:class 3 adenylate cyclase